MSGLQEHTPSVINNNTETQTLDRASHLVLFEEVPSHKSRSKHSSKPFQLGPAPFLPWLVCVFVTFFSLCVSASLSFSWSLSTLLWNGKDCYFCYITAGGTKKPLLIFKDMLVPLYYQCRGI